MKSGKVRINESLYAALDETGRPIATINEGVHHSVLLRYSGAGSQLCSDDVKGTCALEPYNPENLAPFFKAMHL